MKTESSAATSRRNSIRAKTRRLEKEILDQVNEHYRKPVAEWDWEELSRGAPKDENGNFLGKRPSWITPIVVAEAKRRMRQLTEEELMIHAMQAIDVLRQLMTDNDTDMMGRPLVSAAVKLQAAQYVINHVIGTPKIRTEVTSGGDPLAELLGGVLVNPDGRPSHNEAIGVIEGEVVETDDDE